MHNTLAGLNGPLQNLAPLEMGRELGAVSFLPRWWSPGPVDAAGNAIASQVFGLRIGRTNNPELLYDVGQFFNLFPLGGTTGGIVVRQKGGLAGSKEIQVYHDGTRAFADVLSGGLRIRAVNGQEYFSVYDTSGNLMLVLTGGSNFFGRGSLGCNSTDGVNATGIMTNGGFIGQSSGYYALTSTGTTSSPDTSLYRLAAGVWGVGTGAASGAAWLQNTGGEACLASAFTSSNATLANTNLSLTVKAGRSYRIEGILVFKCSQISLGFDRVPGGTAGDVNRFSVFIEGRRSNRQCLSDFFNDVIYSIYHT